MCSLHVHLCNMAVCTFLLHASNDKRNDRCQNHWESALHYVLLHVHLNSSGRHAPHM